MRFLEIRKKDINRKFRCKCLIIILISFSFFYSAENSFAAPSISGVSGTISHGQNITITGTGFGTKTNPAPTVWDDCSGTDPLDLWDDALPSAANANYNGNYRTPEQVQLYGGSAASTAHAHASKFFCGCAIEVGETYTGANTLVKKVFTVNKPSKIYASWYERRDPNWNWDLIGTDNNFKIFDYGNGSVMNGSGLNWYIEQDPGGGTGWDANPIGGFGWQRVGRGSTEWEYYPVYDGLEAIKTNESLAWIKVEVEVNLTSDNSGYLKTWENGRLVLNMHNNGTSYNDYNGVTDTQAAGTRNVLIGGYQRDQGANTQWRYFNDIYFDQSAQRVLIGNASTLENSTTLREIQIPSVWIDNGQPGGASITAKVNQGGFSDSQEAWLYVFDADGTPNAAGYPITFGGSGGDVTAPNVPGGLAVS